jgi:hypothetical protein
VLFWEFPASPSAAHRPTLHDEEPVYVRRTPAIAAHTRAAQADAKPALPTARFPSRGIAGQAPTPSALPGPRPDTRPAPEVASHRVV